MRKVLLTVFTILLAGMFFTPALALTQKDYDDRVSIASIDATSINLEFTSIADDFEQVELDNGAQSSVFIPGEGVTYEYGKPHLPRLSRFVVVPPNAGLEFECEIITQSRIEAEASPELCLEEETLIGPENREIGVEGVYPHIVAEMSEPTVIRGVRLVKVTTYPVQYDAVNREYIHNQHIRTSINITGAEPVNPVRNPIRRNRSPQFLKFIDALAINGDLVGRDDPDRDSEPEYIGHYLIVTHEDLLEYAGPFIEWRRKAGYKMDVLSLSNNQASSPNTVKNEIQDRYDAYLDDGIDPFDHVLLIGDRRTYSYPPQAGRVLEAPQGSTVWRHGAAHADYEYACLEGNDDHPDVGLSRFASGNQAMMELAVGRTLLYEATPDMDDESWFTRGGVFSQHWGNSPQSAWHVTIHTNVRWGVEVLERKGFDDIGFHEVYAHDQYGRQVGPFIRNLMNEGTNVLIGRAENYYFVPGRGNRNFDQEVEENTVFPIEINTSGHGEWSREIMFRTGSGNNLKGYVATSYGWGGPSTATMSAAWLEWVNAVMMKDMTFGWGYSYAITAFEQYFPNFNWMGQQIYPEVKTDIDAFGDPGIQPWIGVPRVVEAEFVDQITDNPRYFEIHVTDADDDSDVAGAQVTFYAPGNRPNFNNDNYADYDDMFMVTTTTDADGMARFVFEDGVELDGDEAFATVTGRDIRPFLGEIEIVNNISSVDLARYTLTETEGNDNDEINPGETFELELTADYLANQGEIENVTAIVTSLSPWVEVEENEISFGAIPHDENADGDEAVTIHIHPACPDGISRPITKPKLSVEFRSGNDTYKTAIELVPSAPHFVLARIIDGDQIPMDRHNLDLQIENAGGLDSPELTGTVHTQGMGVSVVVEEARYPAIRSGRSSRVQGDEFLIAGNAIAIPGNRYPLILVLETEAGFIDTVFFDLQVGESGENTPLGPDGYGYICFDDTDTDWDVAPDFDWIEISVRERDRDFDGEACDFNGQSAEDVGESEVVEMGMSTTFYGVEYDRITISTNGFIAMGDQGGITNYQNWPMDKAIGGGVGMIAPLWDWLDYQNNESGVYYYHDEDEGMFIVEWYNMRHHQGGNSDLNFQVILYDNEVWITETGDQNVLIQYKDVSNVRGQVDGQHERDKNNPYASVGISSPDGTAGINYTFGNEYPVQAAPLEDERALLFATSPRFRSGTLFGTVTDVETGEGVAGAAVYTEHGFTAISDENGGWRINDALAEVPFDITVTAQGYNDSTLAERFLEEDGELEINFSLLHPEFTPTVDDLAAQLEIDGRIQLDFEVSNTGNGPLTWRAEEQLRGDANADPWEIRRQYPVGEIADDSRMQGVLFIDGLFYVAGANDHEPAIYIFDMEGGLIEQFAQPGDNRYGFRDLAWDGEWIWGSGDDVIFALTLEGELVRQFEGPFNPNNNLAWDIDREILWVSSTTSDIVGIDREGGRIRELDRHDFRIYGLAYWPDDPDGKQLYIFHKNNDIADQIIHKMNPDNGDTSFVTTLEPEGGGSPIAAHITNQFDVYSWVFTAVSNNGADDRIDVWQVDARRDWFTLEPITGVLNPEETQEFTLELNATGLPAVRFEADLVFLHNADDGRFILPVTLDVLEGQRNVVVDLFDGWNLISLNVAPENPEVPEVFADIVANDLLVMVKDGDGNFYLPERNFNNIDRWEVAEGYQVYVTGDTQLEVFGDAVLADQAIELDEGWNLSAYFPTIAMEPQAALGGIADELIIAKDGWGRFYMPEFDFSNMGELSMGAGYYYKVTAPVDLVYQFANQAAAKPAHIEQPVHFTGIQITEANMSVLAIANPSLAGWELGAFTASGALVGAGTFDAGGRCGLAVWADAETTDKIDGAVDNEALTYKLWNGERELPAALEPVKGGGAFKADDFFAGRLLVDGTAPASFGIHESYPNPTNGPVRLAFGLEQAGEIALNVYDLSGRTVAGIVQGSLQAGYHRLTWNTDLVPSGLYLIRLESAGKVNMRKVAVVK